MSIGRVLRQACPTRHGRRYLNTVKSTPSTVNADEIAFFSSLSSEWWDESGEFAMLHRMNPARVGFIRDRIRECALEDDEAVNSEANLSRRNFLSGLTALDIGCGGGLLSESLARLGARTTAIDASSSNIEIARIHAQHDPSLKTGLEYRHTTAEELAAENKTYDIVCSMEVIEHVDNPSAFLKSCASLVKPGGHLFLSTIARTPFSYFSTILLAEDVLQMVSKGTHHYSKFIKPSEMLDYFHRSPTFSSSQTGERSLLSNNKSLSSEGLPWISRLYNGVPTRKEAEIRHMVYNPLRGSWSVLPRAAIVPPGLECNYLFWARKPHA